MDFSNRLKKEMSEGVVRAVLEHAGYRVTDFGIEKQIAGLSHLSQKQYMALEFPDAVRMQPDFVVISCDEVSKLLVEVKFRNKWCIDVLEQVRNQVEIFKEIILVSFNASAPNPRNYENSPSRYLRCCRLRFLGDEFQIELWDGKSRQRTWKPMAEIENASSLWWKMSPLPEIFGQFKEDECRDGLRAAVMAISGLLDGQDDKKTACKIANKSKGETFRQRHTAPNAASISPGDQL